MFYDPRKFIILIEFKFLCEDHQQTRVLEDFDEPVQAFVSLMLCHFKTQGRVLT